MNCYAGDIRLTCRAVGESKPFEANNQCDATLKITKPYHREILGFEQQVIAVAENSLNTQEKNQYHILKMTCGSLHDPTYHHVAVCREDIKNLFCSLRERIVSLNNICRNLSQERVTPNKAEEKLINNLKEYEELLNTQMEIQIQPSSTKVRRSLSD